MAMNIESMFTVRDKPWANIGVSVDHALTAAEAIEMAGLNWQVKSAPIFDENGLEIPGYRANVRQDTKKILGVVGGKYSILQNQSAFDFADAMTGDGLTYEVAGCAKEGAVVWILAKMPDRLIVGDSYSPYICFMTTHDGSGATKVCMTPLRIICNNMLNMMLRKSNRKWSTVHKGDIQGKLNQARATLGLTGAYLNSLEDMADSLANQRFGESEVKLALDKMLYLPESATERAKTNVQTVRDGIYACIMAPDLQQFLWTKWGFVNAVADYVDHSSPLRKTANWEENRFLKIVDGTTLLDKAMQVVTA